MTSRTRAELALAGVTLIWGTTFVLVKSALTDVSTLLFLALRFTLAGFVLALLYKRSLRRAGLAPAIGAGCLLFVAYAFQTAGLELTTASKSAFLTGLSVPMVPLASSVVYRIRPRLFEVAGILIASSGMAVMTLPSGRFEMNRGDLLSFLCAVTFALHIVVVSHYSPLVGFETVAVGQVITAALLGTGSVFLAGPVRFAPTPQVAAAIVVTGLLATALAFTIMAWAQRYTTATRSALIFSVEPVVAWLTSWLVAGETLSGRAKIGAGLILLGVLLVEVRWRGPREAETKQTRETSL